MKNRKIHTDLSPEEVKLRFSMDREMEKHSIWGCWKRYNSPRVGLHLYETKKGLWGYYEDGTKNRFGDLHRWKTWVSIRIKPQETGSIIDYRIVPNPYIFLLFCIGLFSVLEAIITRHWDDLVGGFLGLVIMYVIINDVFNVTDLIVKTIQSRLNDVICKEEQ